MWNNRVARPRALPDQIERHSRDLWFLVLFFWPWSFEVFLLLSCRHTASTPITSGTAGRLQVVCSNKEVWKRLTESNSTPTMDLGHMNVVLKWCICMFIVFFHPPLFDFLFFFRSSLSVYRVGMDVLWAYCSVLCRMYERSKEVTREWLWQPGLPRAPRLGFETPHAN